MPQIERTNLESGTSEPGANSRRCPSAEASSKSSSRNRNPCKKLMPKQETNSPERSNTKAPRRRPLQPAKAAGGHALPELQARLPAFLPPVKSSLRYGYACIVLQLHCLSFSNLEVGHAGPWVEALLLNMEAGARGRGLMRSYQGFWLWTLSGGVSEPVLTWEGRARKASAEDLWEVWALRATTG